MEQLQELLVDGLRDIYDAEKQLVRALPKLTKAISNAEVKDAFTSTWKSLRTGDVEWSSASNCSAKR